MSQGAWTGDMGTLLLLRIPSGLFPAAEPAGSLSSAERKENSTPRSAIFNQKKCKTSPEACSGKSCSCSYFLARKRICCTEKAVQGLPQEERERGWLTAGRGELLPAAAGQAVASPPCSERRR